MEGFQEGDYGCNFNFVIVFGTAFMIGQQLLEEEVGVRAWNLFTKLCKVCKIQEVLGVWNCLDSVV